MKKWSLGVILFWCFFCGDAHAQAVKAQPYNGQLRTDPAVGNVQGIQRYGRALKTDPDEGEGFSYHVYPMSYSNAPAPLAPGIAIGAGGLSGFEAKSLQQTKTTTPGRIQLAREVLELEQLITKYQGQPLETTLRKLHEEKQSKLTKIVSELGTLNQRVTGLQKTLDETQDQSVKVVVEKALSDARTQIGVLEQGETTFEGKSMPQTIVLPSGNTVNNGYPGDASPYPPPFDATAGIRNMDMGSANPLLFNSDTMGAKALGVTRSGMTSTATDSIYHQPLIQVKMRIVEVARGSQLQTSSVLDYVSNSHGSSLISGNNVNNDMQRETGVTRFPAGNLITFPGTANSGLSSISGGSGMLVNITTNHLNYIARFLATEFNGDLVTAPEVVTLNGQNVEFVAGSKLPFALGQNVILGNTANVQQYFYKNVGTFVSVTPRIVNWGLHGEGEGNAVVNASEICDWDAAALWAINFTTLPAEEIKSYKDNAGKTFPIALKTQLLQHLKKYSRKELLQKGFPLKCIDPSECPCNWNPKDCTIDLSVVVRTSDAGTINISSKDGDRTINTSIPTEQDVRAIANVIQIKSGHGVVMAGLIGEREIQEISKVPLLGDLPLVGFFFRSKGTNRQKTELLIFLEAEVLDTRPEYARTQSASNFTLSNPYVAGGFLENPLEYGMQRAGFGTYLPPVCKDEQVFWERFGRKVRKMSTALHDTFE